MIETFFGSPSPVWTGVVPGVAWPPGSMPVGRSASPGSGAAGPAAPFAVGAPVFSPPGDDLSAGIQIPAGPVGFGAVVPTATVLATIAMRRGQPQGPTTDAELEEFVYDALDWLPGASDVEVRSDGGRLTLTGSVTHRRLKRDVGEIAWSLPRVVDVQNNLTIATRRRPRASAREVDSAQGRKTA